MPKINLKKHVWHKYAISGGVLAGITAITLGTMYGYSKTSNEKLGRKNFTDEAELKNIFIDRNAKPESFFLEVHNNKHKVHYDPLTEVVTDGKTKLSSTEYLDKYYAKHHALPYLNIKYGSFNFYNQYIEAVSPLEFYKFTEWFMKNVSWGPEIITLKSFSIVKGVEMAGNSITLGSHSNKNKEYTTIKFFPDAFFGTLPIYSSLSGRGNAQDSLTYKLNKSVLSEPELRKFLENIGKYNALANISNKTINEQFFRGITNVRYLKNQKVYALRRPEWEKEVLKTTYSTVEKNRLVQKSPYLLVVAANSLSEAKEKFASKLKEYKDKDSLKLLDGFSAENVNFEEKVIANAEIKVNEYNNTNEIVDKQLLIHFEDGSSYTIHNAFGEILNATQEQNGQKSFKTLGKYVQFDKALKNAKSLIEDLTSRFIEQIRTRFEPNKFSEEILKKSLLQFSELNGLYREWLTLRQTIENMEADLRNYAGARKAVEEAERLIQKLDKEIKEANSDETKKKDLEAQKTKAMADKKAAEAVINIEIFKKTLEARTKERESFIKTLEGQSAQFKEAINKANSDIKLKHTLEKELKRIEFTIKNTRQLNEDDKSLLDELKDINGSSSNGNNNGNQQKLVNALTIVITKNKDKASALLDSAKKSGKITELTSKLASHFGIKTDDIETLNALVAMYDSFANDPSIDKLQAESFSSKNPDEKVKLLKQVDKTIFETSQQLNRLVTGTNPTDQFVEKDYFAVDVAYLPNELISIETLVDANTKAKLNWRDFYNLDEFVKDRKNILPDGATEFFAYSKFVNDQKDELSKKNAHLGADFDYAKISDKREAVKKDLEKVDAEIAKFDNKVETVKKLVVPYFENKDLFPEEFTLLYSEVLDPKTNKKNFDEFWSSNADVVLEYLKKALGEENGTNDDEGKTINGFIKKHSQEEFTELTKLFAESSQLIEKINSGKSTDDEKLQEIELGKKIRDLRDKIDENDNHIQNKIARVINAKIDFQKAINLVNELKKDIAEYKKNIAKRYNSTFLMQLSDYQLRFLSSQSVKENSELANAYKKLISSFNNSSANLSKKVEEYINLVEENKKQFANTLSNEDYAGWYSLLKHGDEAAIGKKLKETQGVIRKRETRESIFKTKWEKISNKPLVNALNDHKLDNSKTLTDTLKSYADRVLALIKEFFEKASDKSQSVYDQLKKKYADDLKKVEDSLKSKKSEKSSLNGKSESALKITKLNQEIDKLFAESVVIAEQLEQLKFFKNWHKTGFNELDDVKKKIDSNSLPALHLLIPFNKLEAELSVFLNDRDSVLETNLFKVLNRLKKVLGEINSEIRTKIRPMVHNEAKAYFEAYESYLTYKTELDGLRADKDLLEQGNKYLVSLKNDKDHPEYANFYNNLYKKFEEDSKKNEASLLGSLSLKDDLLSIFESKAESKKANVATFKKDLSSFTNALVKDIMHDEVVAKANSYLNNFKKPDSKLAGEMKKIENSENSSELGKDLKAFNETITSAYEKEVETFIKTFKDNLIVEQYKVIFRELKSSKSNEENESEGNKKVPEFLKKFEKASNGGGSVREIAGRFRRSLPLPDSGTRTHTNSELDNFLKALYSNINGVEVSTIETFKKFIAELQKKATSLVSKILNENLKHKSQKDKFSNELLKHFNTEVESIYKQIGKDDYDNANVVAGLSALSGIVSEFNKKFNIETSQNSELANYVAEFNNLSKRLEEIVKDLSAYKTLILGFLNNEGWETRTNVNISKFQTSWFTMPFIELLKSDKTKLAKLTAYISSKKDLDEKTKKAYLQALTAENLNKIEAELAKFKDLPQLTPRAGTSAINPEVLFNSFVKRMTEVEKHIDKSVEEFGEYLGSLGEYFDTLIAPALRDHKLYEAYNHSLAHSAKIVENIRKTQLIKEARELDKNVQARQITSEDDVIVAKSKIELIDILTKKNILKPNASKEEIDKLIFKADISDINKKGSVLEVTIKNVDSENPFGSQTKFGSKFVKFAVDANADKNVLKNMNEFFSVLGYKKMVAPSVIKEENEVNNPETGKSERSYDVFADAYEGLTDELLKEVPYAGEWLDGLHIKKSINSDGVMEYSLENGKYLGFTKNSRVGLWAILKMSDPNFKGISTDFLKFVGAHEYGHHITLNGAHDLSNKGSDPIFVSALTPNSTPNINNYYSKDAVELYLKARTHVELGTKRLLDEFGALKDYGEYAEFRFAKKGKDGKITFEDKAEDTIKSMEKESDIWGVGLEDRDLWKALSNKNRRFLQDFAGMLEAVKSRREQNGLTANGDEKWLSPFDMWVINAIDYYSGTLNPTVNSALKDAAKVKYMVKNDKGEYEFKEASLSMLKGIIKDGQGNLIEFEEVTKNGSKQIEPKVVEGLKDAEGNYILITKVLMHNADGSPVISVPLNVDLTDTKSPYYDKNAVKFVNDKINTIVKTIKSLIVDRFNINGWDTSDTRLSLDPKIIVDYPETRNIFGAGLPSDVTKMFFNIYKNYLTNRDPDQGTYKKGTDGKVPFIKYYNKDGSENTSSNFPKAVPSNLIYGNPKDYISKNGHGAPASTNGASGEVKLGHVLSALFNSGNSLNNNINGGAGQVLWIDKDTMYMPNVKLETAFTDPFFAQTLPSDYLQVFNSKKIIKWLSKYTPTFITSSANPNGVWNMLNSSGQIVTFPDTSQADFTQVTKLKMNYTESLKRLDHNVLTGLFNSFASGVMKNGSIEFDDYKKWLEFVNVDLTKAKYDKATDTVKWEVDYVQKKINIDNFKNAYKTEIIDKLANMTEMSEEEKNVFREFYKKAMEDSSNQMWANDIMRRFSSSLFAMFNSALTFDKLKNSNKDAMWIFDQKHGYGEFKKQEFKIDGADRKKWEIGADDTIKTYENIAKEFGVDLKAINLVDSLVFDSKIQLYTDQTIVHVSLQQFELVNIFTSLANAAFHTGPSDDVKNYFINKTERKFNELFSDYTYNFAEVINRDNLQITYSPSNHDFGNTPSFLSNISEANTGLEYVVDGTTTAKWKSKALKLNDRGGRDGIKNAILDYERLADNEEKHKANALNLRYKKAVLSDDKNLSDDSNYNNSYFGEFQSINNGWFKDRWYRDFLNFKLYDDKGAEIVDDTIRIKDLEGKVVNTRARAYWQYYIQSQGVGKRNISGIWRDGSKDAVAMFGYLSSDVAEKANYLAFKDRQTGEIKTLKLTKDNTSNMFYYKNQHIENEKKFNEAKSDEERKKIRHTLADEQYDYSDSNGKHKGKGFVSWVSDYGIMSKYRNAILLPGHTYSVYFSSDEQGTKDILNTDLGTWESIAENGKTFSQASIRMAKGEKPYKIDENGNNVYENILYVYDQFNGVK